MVIRVKQNCHRLFRAKEVGYVNKIKPTMSQKEQLEQCQKKIRSCLKKTLTEYTTKLVGEPITPCFRVQGSWAYGTCNQPARPEQEMDLDYGVYLPSCVFGEQRSDISAKLYFAVVEDALSELCKHEGWKIDNSKATCIRLLDVMENAHIDVPIYAVPEEMFNNFKEDHILRIASLTESLSMESQFFAMDSHNQIIYLSEAELVDLSKITTIHMALRDGGWKDSDCEKVRQWFNDRLKEQEDKGTQLRYIVRYLKGWRDQQWLEGGPTSILLMIIAYQNYKYFKNRDDLSLHHVTERLSNALINNVYEPGIEGHEDEDFNGKFNIDQRKDNASEANFLFDCICTALTTNKRELSIDNLQKPFGQRVPNDQSLVVTDLSNGNAHFAEPPKVTAKPTVIPTQTGG